MPFLPHAFDAFRQIFRALGYDDARADEASAWLCALAMLTALWAVLEYT